MADRGAANPLSSGESLLFLTDEQLRRGIEAMFFAYRGFTADPDRILEVVDFKTGQEGLQDRLGVLVQALPDLDIKCDFQLEQFQFRELEVAGRGVDSFQAGISSITKQRQGSVQGGCLARQGR